MSVDFNHINLEKAPRMVGFVKRKYTLAWLIKDALKVFPRVFDIYAIAVKNRMPEAFREEIMVVVSRANGCSICNFTHHDFAQVAGVDLERLQQLEKADFSGVDARRKLAFDFAVAKSLVNFGSIDPGLQMAFEKAYTPQEQKDIEFVSRFITIMNLCCNKLEAFSFRLGGGKPDDSSIFDEVVISGIAMAIIPVMYALVALARDESYIAVWKDFFEFFHHYEAAVVPILDSTELKVGV